MLRPLNIWLNILMQTSLDYWCDRLCNQLGSKSFTNKCLHTVMNATSFKLLSLTSPTKRSALDKLSNHNFSRHRHRPATSN